MNREKNIINIISLILNAIALILAIIGILNDSELFACTGYDVALVLMILGQELKIRYLSKDIE